MKKLNLKTRLYLIIMYILGSIFLAQNILQWQSINLIMLAALCVLASLALIFKVEGATKRSHYTFSFIVYGFAFILLGFRELLLLLFFLIS